METATLCLFTDGASRGNPGPSAFAYILADDRGNVIEERAGRIGRKTNNEAEYHALIEGLRAALRNRSTSLAVYSDSELLVRQMNGAYRVASPRLLPLYLEAQGLSGRIGRVEYHAVPRDHRIIARADRLCNEALDRDATSDPRS